MPLRIVKHRPAIRQFLGEYRFLSNFWPVRIIDPFNGLTYPTVEHAYQAAKSDDRDDKLAVLRCPTPAMAKQAGQCVSLRAGWERDKKRVMRHLLIQKFIFHEELGQRLIATSPRYLIEGNLWHDNYWGNCVCQRCYHIHGRNHLGRLLMEIRAIIREGDKPPAMRV